MAPEDFNPEVSNVDEVPEHLDQYREALASVFGILLSGVVGDSSKTFKVTVSGHGNPGHEPQSGWANDSMVISIYQVEEGTP
jgi:hypothetical protein